MKKNKTFTVGDTIHCVNSTVQNGSVSRQIDKPWLLMEIFSKQKVFHGSLHDTSVCDVYMFNWHFDGFDQYISKW